MPWLVLLALLIPSGAHALSCRYDWECRVTAHLDCGSGAGVAAVHYGTLDAFVKAKEEYAHANCPGSERSGNADAFHARCEKQACLLVGGPSSRAKDLACERDSDCVLNWTGCCAFDLVRRANMRGPSPSSTCKTVCTGEKAPPYRTLCLKSRCVADAGGFPVVATAPREVVSPPPTVSAKPSSAPVPQVSAVPGAEGGALGNSEVGMCLHRIKPNVFQVIVRDRSGALVPNAMVSAQTRSRKHALMSLENGFYTVRDLPEGRYEILVRWAGRIKSQPGVERKKVVEGGCPSTEGIEPSVVEVRMN